MPNMDVFRGVFFCSYRPQCYLSFGYDAVICLSFGEIVVDIDKYWYAIK